MKSKDLKVWELRAKDANETPFFHTGMPTLVLVAAEGDQMARAIAADIYPNAAVGGATNAWLDADLTTCREFQADDAGFIASA